MRPREVLLKGDAFSTLPFIILGLLQSCHWHMTKVGEVFHTCIKKASRLQITFKIALFTLR